MKQHFVPWCSFEMNGHYSIQAIIDDLFTLQVILIDENTQQKVILEFGFSSDAYEWQKINEHVISHMQINEQLDEYCQFYKVIDSEFENWIEKASEGIYDSKRSADFRLKHFRIITKKEMIDILAYDEPKVTVL